MRALPRLLMLLGLAGVALAAAPQITSSAAVALGFTDRVLTLGAAGAPIDGQVVAYDSSTSTLRLEAAGGGAAIAPSSPYTATEGVRTITCASSCTVVLPALSTLGDGEAIRVVSTSSSSITVTLDPPTGATIDGGSDGAALAITVGARGVVGAIRLTSSSWGSVQPGVVGWVELYNQSLASVDTASAAFTLGGATWTKQNSGGGSLASDGTGLTITPNASTTATTAPAYTAPLTSFSAAYTTQTLLICTQRDAVDPTCPTPGAGYKSQVSGVGDEDGSPAAYSEYACNSTSPSGQGVQASRNGSSPVKAAVTSSTIHWLCTRLADGLTYTQYYGTSATLDPYALTLISGPYEAADVTPGGTFLAEHVRFYAARGSDAYSALFKRVIVYRWGR